MSRRKSHSHRTEENEGDAQSIKTILTLARTYDKALKGNLELKERLEVYDDFRDELLSQSANFSNPNFDPSTMFRPPEPGQPKPYDPATDGDISPFSISVTKYRVPDEVIKVHH